MNTATPSIVWWIVAAIVIVVICACVVYVRQRSARLRDRFGNEYDRTVAETGSKRQAEAELSAREQRVKGFHLQTLSTGARRRYEEEWRAVQARFVDAPAAAIGDADRLVQNVMRDRGYPLENFDQRAADLSVEHGDDVASYRAAHAIALENEKGEASTEDLRQAMVRYRALFESLTGTAAAGANSART